MKIVKAAIANQSTPQTSLLNSHNTAKPRTYVSLLQGTLSTSTSLIPQKAAINKDLEIVVRLNSAEQKAILKDVATDVILKDLNIRMRRMGRHPVRAIKGLPSGDLAILTISNGEAEILRKESVWTEVLGRNARIVTKTYGIMINGVRIADFNMANKDKAIEHIKSSNADIQALKWMEIK